MRITTKTLLEGQEGEFATVDVRLDDGETAALHCGEGGTNLRVFCNGPILDYSHRRQVGCTTAPPHIREFYFYCKTPADAEELADKLRAQVHGAEAAA